MTYNRRMNRPKTAAPDFLYRCVLDGNGGARELDTAEQPESTDGTVWIHIDVAHEASCRWLLTESGVDRPIAEALLEAETRPRSFSTPDGMLVVLREEFLGRLAQEQNSRMYVLSVVAAIFLPLTFVTGILGMNVGGVPGLNDPNAFLASLGIMVAAAFALAAFFRWKKWL